MAVNRDQHEKDLAAALAALLRQYGDVAARDPGRIPWARFERELVAAIVPELLASHVASATQMASGIKGFELSDEQAAAAAQKWAQAYAATLAGEVVSNTRQRLDHARKQEDAAQLASVLLLLFGDDRAWNIGVTETTRSIEAGKTFTAKRFERETGETLVAIWETEADGKVCAVCRPLNGKRPEYWERFVPGGPPAHVNCRCSLRWQRSSLSRAA